MLAHAYRPQLVGLSTRVFTGCWTSAATAPRSTRRTRPKVFVAPPREKLLLVSNGLFAKYGTWQGRRQGTAERLEKPARSG